jgi:RNA polymerase sigma factor (sigma-70 family)
MNLVGNPSANAKVAESAPHPTALTERQVESVKTYRSAVRGCVELLDNLPMKSVLLKGFLQHAMHGGLSTAALFDVPNEKNCDLHLKRLATAPDIRSMPLQLWRFWPNILLDLASYAASCADEPGTPNSPLPQTVVPGHNENTTPIPADRIRALVAQANAAFENLCESNQRLVVSAAKRFRNRGVDFDDLVQEGNLGLMKGIQRFDPGKGAALSTYLTQTILNALACAVAQQGHVIHFSQHILEIAPKVAEIIKKAADEGQPPPSVKQMASLLGVKEATIFGALSAKPALSLQEPLHDFSEASLEDVIPAAIEAAPYELEERDVEINEMMSMLRQNLTRRAWRLLQLVFGLPGVVEAVDELGIRVNIIRTPARQAQAAAIGRRGAHRIIKIVPTSIT